jgi:nitric oxide reductase subunit B
MSRTLTLHVGYALILLLGALFVGLLAALAYLFPDLGAQLPFVQLRPMHVSAALFWIITGATAGVLHYKREVFAQPREPFAERAFVLLWVATTASVFIFYAFRRFGGREYWEFPPLLGIPIALAWILLLVSYLRSWTRRPRPAPLYVWMWTTGVVFFMLTFLEQNLYHIPWFRQSFLREITVQWKSNGAMVGAWNQMIYGTALYLMVRISGDEGIARGRKVFLFWFLGLSNLMFNWGHHIYNAPTAGWIRHVAYGISMAEWIFFLDIIRGFKAKLAEKRKYDHLLTYRFLVASELWVFLNLVLALFMSIPAVNRYTHGTHITVAHAMGTTIGINTMILLGSFSWLLRMDQQGDRVVRQARLGARMALIGLPMLWFSLIAAGVLKGYRSVALGMTDHQELMEPVDQVLLVFLAGGVVVLAGLGTIAITYLGVLLRGARSRGIS